MPGPDSHFDPFTAFLAAPSKPWSYEPPKGRLMTWPARVGSRIADLTYWLTSPWRHQLDRDAADISVLHRITKLEKQMADMSPLLNKLAEDLRAWGAGPFAALLADNARLTARNAELEGEDAAETAAANEAAAAFNELVAPVNEAPEVPVEIPPVEVPAEPAPADSSAEPTPAA